jgi:predicted Zn-dependent protease
MNRTFHAAAVSALALACIRNPATGKLQLDIVSESQEIDMGKQAAQEVEQTMGTYKDPKVEAYVNRLGQSLAKKTNRPNLPWQFHVVEDSSVNAFALPGGPVFVTRGILGALNSEAELAGVMGHECGHVAARHSATQMSKAQVAQLGLGLGSILSPTIASVGQVAGAGLQVLFLKFSRDDESQADKLGFAYMANDGYDGREMLGVFKTLDRVSKAAGGGKLPEWLETHPDPGNRLTATQDRLKELKHDFTGTKIGRDEYLQIVDGIVYGEDPRQGFFKGPLFLHPELKFQIQFPPGWKTQNTPQAVAAMNDKQDAILQLQPAGKGMSPDQAAQKFFSQQGIQRGQAAQVTVHGLAVMAAYFAGQTDQGQIGGLVTFVTYNGLTYAILGYTAANAVQQHDAEFKSVMGSFGPLTDPSAANVQPAKIQLVKLPQPMTVEQFHQQYPSNLPVEEVAMINGFDDKSGRMEAGQSYKRVVGGPPREQPKQAAR